MAESDRKRLLQPPRSSPSQPRPQPQDDGPSCSAAPVTCPPADWRRRRLAVPRRRAMRQAHNMDEFVQLMRASKNNKLSPVEGNLPKNASYFGAIEGEIQSEETRVRRRMNERRESVEVSELLRVQRTKAVGDPATASSPSRAMATVDEADQPTEAAADMTDTVADNYDHDIEEDVPDADLSSHSMDAPSVADYELEVVYRETLRVIMNRVGAEGNEKSIQSPLMLSHLQEVYGASDELHQRLLAKEQASERPTYHLRVGVIAGEGLDGMDENGLSDPYCTLGLVVLDEALQQRRHDNKKLKDVQDMTSNVHKTAYKMKTLEPEWNETFEFPVDDLTNLYLQVDVWDYDEEDGVGDALKRGSHIKGFRGFSKYLGQVAEAITGSGNDDFIGRCFVSLEAVHQGGVHTWFPLESKRSKTVDGKICLKLAFVQDKSEITSHVDPSWLPRRVYETLYWDFVRHEVNVLKKSGARWRGHLAPVASSILQLFRVQQGISNVQHSAREWQVLAEAQQRHGVKFARLIECLDVLAEDYERAEEKNIRLDETELKDLIDSMDAFVTTSLQLLGKQRDIFPPNSTTSGLPAVRRLSNLLVALSSVYKFKGFTHFFPRKNLQNDITDTIKESTAKWFERTEAEHAPATTFSSSSSGQNGDVQVLEQITEVVRAVKNDLVDAGQFYEHHFKSHLQLSYFAEVFAELDRLMCERVSKVIAKMQEGKEAGWHSSSEDGQKVSTTSFHLFIAVQEVYKYCQTLQKFDVSQSAMSKFQSWFEPFVSMWLEVAEVKAMEMVRKAVDIDKAVKATDALKYGTSAVDVGNTIAQLCNYFNRLEWVNTEERFKFLTMTYESCLNVVKSYCVCIEGKLKEVGYYDTVGQFDISVELTTTLNGFDHSQRIVEAIDGDLNWDDNTASLRSSDRKGPLVADIHKSMIDLFHESVAVIKKRIIDQIGTRMAPDIQMKMERFMNRCAAGSSLEEALDTLMIYLTENLKLMMIELMSSTFMEILSSLYRVCVSIFRKCLDSLEEKMSKAPSQTLFKSIQGGLEAILDFFECDGDGLNREQLNIPEYIAVAGYIDMICASNSDVCRYYYSDIVRHQEEVEEKKFGTVSVAVAYELATETLHVEVIHASDLPAMDLNDSSDPYVTLEVRPPPNPKKIVTKKTSTKKKTLSPLFDEKFFFPLPASQQSVAGTVLYLTCYDWDRVTSDDTMGEVLVPVHDVKQIDSPEEFKSNVTNFTLPLLRPSDAYGSRAFEALQARKSYDTEAAAFIAEREKMFHEMQSDEKLGVST